MTTTAAPRSHKEEGILKKEEKESKSKESTKSEEDTNAKTTLESQYIEENVASTVAPKDSIINRLASALPLVTGRSDPDKTDPIIIEKNARPEHIPDITSLFPDNPVQPRKDNIFEGLETHEIRSLSRSGASPVLKVEHREEPEFENAETEQPNNALEDARTIGPYESVQEYQADQAEPASPVQEPEDSSTPAPDPEPSYRYNIKVRSNGKVLDPPSK